MSKKVSKHSTLDKKLSVKTTEQNTTLSGEAMPAITPLAKIVSEVSKKSLDITAVKKTVAPVKVFNLNKNVSSDKLFILCDGRTISNCKILADMLVVISDDIFAYHVTDNKNDFANWINDLFEDKELAKKISVLRNKLLMSIEIYRYMFEKLEK